MPASCLWLLDVFPLHVDQFVDLDLVPGLAIFVQRFNQRGVCHCRLCDFRHRKHILCAVDEQLDSKDLAALPIGFPLSLDRSPQRRNPQLLLVRNEWRLPTICPPLRLLAVESLLALAVACRRAFKFISLLRIDFFVKLGVLPSFLNLLDLKRASCVLLRGLCLLGDLVGSELSTAVQVPDLVQVLLAADRPSIRLLLEVLSRRVGHCFGSSLQARRHGARRQHLLVYLCL